MNLVYLCLLYLLHLFCLLYRCLFLSPFDTSLFSSRFSYFLFLFHCLILIDLRHLMIFCYVHSFLVVLIWIRPCFSLVHLVYFIFFFHSFLCSLFSPCLDFDSSLSFFGSSFFVSFFSSCFDSSDVLFSSLSTLLPHAANSTSANNRTTAIRKDLFILSTSLIYISVLLL